MLSFIDIHSDNILFHRNTHMLQWFLQLWNRQEANGRHLNHSDSQISGAKMIILNAVSHTHTNKSLSST